MGRLWTLTTLPIHWVPQDLQTQHCNNSKLKYLRLNSTIVSKDPICIDSACDLEHVEIIFAPMFSERKPVQKLFRSGRVRRYKMTFHLTLFVAFLTTSLQFLRQFFKYIFKVSQTLNFICFLFKKGVCVSRIFFERKECLQKTSKKNYFNFPDSLITVNRTLTCDHIRVSSMYDVIYFWIIIDHLVPLLCFGY